MNKYELTLVVNAKIDEDARTAAVEKVKAYIEKANATITNVEDCGLKKLAYEIQKMGEATITSFSSMQKLMYQHSLKLMFVSWSLFSDIFAFV